MIISEELIKLAKTPVFEINESITFSSDSPMSASDYFIMTSSEIKERLSISHLFPNENAISPILEP